MPKQILIVDDSSKIRSLIRCLLEDDSGKEWRICGEAENGEVAVRMVRELSPDLVILDLAMPVMNGLEAARQIAHLAPDTPLLMFTIQTCQQLLADATAVGIKEVLSKSEPMDLLLASVRRLLDRPAV